MNCSEVQASVVDETLPHDGLASHLSTCQACRDFDAAHRTALRLKNVELQPSTRPSVARIQRRLSIAAAFMLMVVGAGGLLALQLPVAVSSTPRRDLPVMTELTPEVFTDESETADLEWAALAQLDRHVAATTQANPTLDDATYRTFGRLPQWLAPTDTQPVRALGRALSPVVFNREY